MNIKPGYKTTEFWVTLLVNVIAAAIGVLSAYGMVTAEEAEAWNALGIAVAPLGMALATGLYAYSRAKVKSNGA